MTLKKASELSVAEVDTVLVTILEKAVNNPTKEFVIEGLQIDGEFVTLLDIFGVAVTEYDLDSFIVKAI